MNLWRITGIDYGEERKFYLAGMENRRSKVVRAKCELLVVDCVVWVIR